jgi:glycosyltransferase involved in cell wall biosynthesis
LKIAGSYTDPRIRVLDNGQNLGLIATLNKGIELARGMYIARMDCDDVSLPPRLEKQVAFMEHNPDVAVCGTWFKKIGSSGEIIRHPATDNDIRWSLIIDCAFAHPSIILRRSVLMDHNLRYDTGYLHAEDYELWTRVADHGKLANLPEVLLYYRVHGEQIGNKFNTGQLATADKVRKTQLEKMGLIFTDEEFELHDQVVAGVPRCNGCLPALPAIDYLLRAEQWLLKLLHAHDGSQNQQSGFFENKLAERWFLICSMSSGAGRTVWNVFRASELSSLVTLSGFQKIKFWIRCMIRWHVKQLGSSHE